MAHIAPQSLAGLPSLALRAGFDDEGIPVGVQLRAPPGREDMLLDIGAHFQNVTAGVQGPWPYS